MAYESNFKYLEERIIDRLGEDIGKDLVNRMYLAESKAYDKASLVETRQIMEIIHNNKKVIYRKRNIINGNRQSSNSGYDSRFQEQDPIDFLLTNVTTIEKPTDESVVENELGIVLRKLIIRYNEEAKYKYNGKGCPTAIGFPYTFLLCYMDNIGRNGIDLFNLGSDENGKPNAQLDEIGCAQFVVRIQYLYFVCNGEIHADQRKFDFYRLDHIKLLYILLTVVFGGDMERNKTKIMGEKSIYSRFEKKNIPLLLSGSKLTHRWFLDREATHNGMSTYIYARELHGAKEYSIINIQSSTASTAQFKREIETDYEMYQRSFQSLMDMFPCETSDFFILQYKYKTNLFFIFEEEITTLPLETKLYVLHAIANKLKELHAQDLYHRCLTPNSIICEKNNQGKVNPLLINYSYTKIENHDGQEYGTMFGDLKRLVNKDKSKLYYAPEFFKDETTIDWAKYDSYAFGVMALNFLYGEGSVIVDENGITFNPQSDVSKDMIYEKKKKFNDEIDALKMLIESDAERRETITDYCKLF